MARRRLPENMLLPKGLSPHGRKYRARSDGKWITFDGPVENAITAFKAWAGGQNKRMIGVALDEWAFHYLPGMVRSKALKQRTMEDYQRDIEPLKIGVGHVPFQALTPAICAKLRDALRETKGGHARNIYSCFVSFMRWSVETGRIDRNVAKDVRQLPIRRSRELVTDEDYLAIYGEGTRSVQIGMTLGLRTAARPADILKMGPRHVKNGVLDFDQGKTGGGVRILVEGDLR